MNCPNCGNIIESGEICMKCGSNVNVVSKVDNFRKSFHENKSKIPGRIDLEENDTLVLNIGKFTVVKKLGRGGFGTVYKIVDNNNNQYAIKILDLWRIKPNEYKGLIERFKQEFKAGQVESEHIVKSFFKGDLEGNPYIVMELCEDGNLSDRLLEFYNESNFTVLALQVLKGLEALHNRNMIHRDIKPENIIFKNKRIAKLTDFGISGDLDNRMTKVNWMGSAKEIWGTPLYSSPEQLNKKNSYKKAGPTMDVFSFAVMMFEVISSGQLPFATLEEINKTPLVYSERVKKGKFEDISKYRKDISSIWSTILNKSLNPNPEYRYQSTSEIIEIIENNKTKSSNFILPEIDNNNNNYRLTKNFSKEEKKEVSATLFQIGSNEFILSDILKTKKNSVLTIGRYDETTYNKNDIDITELSGRHISRKHATVELEYHQWYLRDGQWDNNKSWIPSKNGTFVNDIKINSEDGIKLKDKDRIKMGETFFEFKLK